MGEKETVNEAFYERNMLALMLAECYYWHEGWKVLVINPKSITRQLTFHVPHDFDTMWLPEVDQSCWDGHTTEEKWKRVKDIITSRAFALWIRHSPNCPKGQRVRRWIEGLTLNKFMLPKDAKVCSNCVHWEFFDRCPITGALNRVDINSEGSCAKGHGVEGVMYANESCNDDCQTR